MPVHTPDATADATPRVIDIELLALDLTSCTRCVGTRSNIEHAIRIVRPVLEAMGARTDVRTTLIESEGQARRHGFVTSPTVRVDGHDIAFETAESECDSCADLCGCAEGTACRVWHWHGREYTEAPVGLVVEALLDAAGAQRRAARTRPRDDDVPGNLRRFFAGRTERHATREAQLAAGEACCAPAEQETCCAAEEKAGCCDAATPSSCGCN